MNETERLINVALAIVTDFTPCILIELGTIINKYSANLYSFFRLKIKKNRENLEEFLLTCDRVTSMTKFYKCEEMFSNLEVSTY